MSYTPLPIQLVVFHFTGGFFSSRELLLECSHLFFVLGCAFAVASRKRPQGQCPGVSPRGFWEVYSLRSHAGGFRALRGHFCEWQGTEANAALPTFPAPLTGGILSLLRLSATCQAPQTVRVRSVPGSWLWPGGLCVCFPAVITLPDPTASEYRGKSGVWELQPWSSSAWLLGLLRVFCGFTHAEDCFSGFVENALGVFLGVALNL